MQALIREVYIKTVPGLGRKCPTVFQSTKVLAWLPGLLPHWLEGSRISPTAGPRGAIWRAEPVVRANDLGIVWIDLHLRCIQVYISGLPF